MKLVKKKHNLYAKYMNCKHPAYMRVPREADIEIRRSKRRFEIKLAANIKEDVKSFYAYVSSKRKVNPRVGPIVSESGDAGFNEKLLLFIGLYEREYRFLANSYRSSLINNNTSVLTDISFTEDAVRKKLDSLWDDKYGGLDDLPPRMLKIIK